MDDLERLRLHLLDTRRPDVRSEPGGPPAMVGQVVTTTPAVGKFLLVNPVTVTAPDTEGSDAVMTVDTTRTVPVYLLGPGVPATGDYLACRHVDYRWVAEKRTSGGGAIIPSTCIPGVNADNPSLSYKCYFAYPTLSADDSTYYRGGFNYGYAAKVTVTLNHKTGFDGAGRVVHFWESDLTPSAKPSGWSATDPDNTDVDFSLDYLFKVGQGCSATQPNAAWYAKTDTTGATPTTYDVTLFHGTAEIGDATEYDMFIFTAPDTPTFSCRRV